MNTLAVVLGAGLLISVFASIFAVFVHDLGWKEAVGGFLFVFGVVGVIALGASLISWGLTS